jgi:hypothetical protein
MPSSASILGAMGIHISRETSSNVQQAFYIIITIVNYIFNKMAILVAKTSL